MLVRSLWGLVVLLVVVWLVLWLLVHITSFLVHLLLVAAVIVVLYNLFVGARARRL